MQAKASHLPVCISFTPVSLDAALLLACGNIVNHLCPWLCWGGSEGVQRWAAAVCVCEAPLEVTWSNCSAQARSPRAGCTRLCLVGFWVCLRMETTQPLWATCASTWSPSQEKSVFWCSKWTSSVSVCAYCPMSCHWVLVTLGHWVTGKSLAWSSLPPCFFHALAGIVQKYKLVEYCW